MDAKVLWALIIGLTIYAIFFIVLPRIRDIGMSSWWLLAILIPVANEFLGLILLFRAPLMKRHTQVPVPEQAPAT